MFSPKSNQDGWYTLLLLKGDLDGRALETNLENLNGLMFPCGTCSRQAKTEFMGKIFQAMCVD